MVVAKIGDTDVMCCSQIDDMGVVCISANCCG